MGRVGLTRLAFIITLAASLSSCRCHHTVADDTRDSVRVITNERREIVVDTVEVYIGEMAQERFTPDTFSFLRNSVAESEAEVSGGVLRHSLKSIPQIKKTAVTKEIVTRDSVVFRDRVITRTVKVKKKAGIWRKLYNVLPPVLLIVIIFLFKFK